MAYMVFKLVEAKLQLSDDKKIQLERVFSAARGLHNHYVSKFQIYTDEEVRRMARNRNTFPFFLNWEDVSQHQDPLLDRNTFNSMAQIICNTWRDFVAGKRPRPAFKAPRHIQSFWILDTHGVSVTKWAITLPGPAPIELTVEPGTFSGGPSAVKVSRDKNGDYHIAGLYEQNAKAPVDDALLTMMGIRLQVALAKYHRTKNTGHHVIRKKEEMDLHRMDISITRMTVIALMLKRSKAIRKEEVHETLSAETV